MKRSLFILSLLIVTCSLSAQSVLSFGARGGLEFMMPKSELTTLQTKVGYAGLVDIGYTYYWFTQKGEWGIHTGLSGGLAQNASQIGLQDHIYRQYHDGTVKHFTVEGNMDIILQRAYGEVPLMAAFRKNGIVARLGLKGQFAFWSNTSQKIKANDLSDPYDDRRLFIGGTQKMEFKGGAPVFSLLAAMQIGYELKVRKTDRLGVFAYLDYNFWNTGTGTTSSLTSITPPSDSSFADISVGNALSAVVTRINPIQVGVSVYYALELRTYHRHTKSSSIWEDNTTDFQGQEVK